MRTESDLRRALARLDGRGYPGYKQLKGDWDLGDMVLRIDRVQGDPFAAPSRIRVELSADVAGLPAEALDSVASRVAAADFLARCLAHDLDQHGGRRTGSGKSGGIFIERPVQEVLPRTTVLVHADGRVEARLQVGLPAAGRRIRGRAAAELLCDDVPDAADASLRAQSIDVATLVAHIHCVQDQHALRRQLGDHGLVAFVANGARLPRASGVDPRPLTADVTTFQAPESLAVTLQTPHSGDVVGLGIREGITVVAGGGYHGKSTLLRALQTGVYDHIPGDGRERVVTRADAVKIRAEDGRRIASVDISPFITNLPGGTDTARFCTDTASGSTSQAAAIVEALELGSRLLLLDEDTSATNLMLRDARMQALVAAENEPITPLTARISGLFATDGVSTILVMGGSGDYLDVAGTVLMMDRYRPVDMTGRAAEIVAEIPREALDVQPLSVVPKPRHPRPKSIDPSRGKRDVKVSVRDLAQLGFGRFDVDLSALEQLVEPAQVRAIGEALLWLKRCFQDGDDLPTALDRLDAALSEEGIGLLAQRRGDFAMVRRFEIGAALNRLRSLTVR